MAFGEHLPRRWRDRWYDDESRPASTAMPMRRFFDDIFSDIFDFLPASRQLTSFNPRINVSDNESEIIVVAELPGMDEKDIDVTFTRDGLLVRGEKKEERRDGDRNRYYECTYGSFERYIPLHTDIKENEVRASFERGVLTITLPKTEDARSRTKKIQIQSGASGRKAVDVESGERSQGSSARSNSSRGSQNDAQAAR